MIDFVSEWTTMSAPWAIGRIRAGVAQVASMMNGMPQRMGQVGQGLDVGEGLLRVARRISM